MSYDEPAICDDCGVDTAPGTTDDVIEGRVEGQWEWYMVHDHLWPPDRRFLCIGCLENHLMRRLLPTDFPITEMNSPSGLETPRLSERLGHDDETD